MKSYVKTIALIVAGGVVSVHAATDIATARALGEDAEVEIGPVIVSTTNDTTGGGFAFCVQDASGGVTLYWSSGERQKGYDLINNNNIVPGDRITLKGTNDWYAGLYELADVEFISKDSTGAPPDPIVISINDMQDGAPTGKIVQSMLVEVGDVAFRNPGAAFEGGSNYTISNSVGTNASVRIQDFNDPLVGQTVPGGNVTIRGIMAQFDFGGNDTLAGYQLLPLEVIPDTPQDDPNISCDTNCNFGTIYAGTPRELSLEVKNGGASNVLALSSCTPKRGDTNVIVLSTTGFPFNVPAGDNQRLDFTFSGMTLGAAYTATYELASNDPGEPLVDVELIGNVSPTNVSMVWINELSYDDGIQGDQQEFIELCGPAGMSISNWVIELWNGNAFNISNYGSHVIGDFTFGSLESGFGFFVLVTSDSDFNIPNYDEIAEFPNIQNGPADAILLKDANGVMQHFFQYETDWCTNFPMGTPDDLTWRWQSNSNNTSIGFTGEGEQRPVFEWGWRPFTPRAVNTDQVLVPEPAVLMLGLAGVLALRARR